MNTRIKATNLTLTPAISAYADKRFDKITTLVGGDPSVMCDVVLGRTSDHHKKGDVFRAEIHITGPGLDAYASAEHDDLYAAIDEVRDEITRELKAKKGKRISLVRRTGSQAKALAKGIMPWGEAGWVRKFRKKGKMDY